MHTGRDTVSKYQLKTPERIQIVYKGSRAATRDTGHCIPYGTELSVTHIGRRVSSVCRTGTDRI